MRKVIKKLLDNEDWILRIAVAFPIFWAGVRSMVNPAEWIRFVPPQISSFIDSNVFLVALSFALIIAAIGIIAGFWRIFFSGFVVVFLIGILIFYGIDDITFRDVGLTLAAFILFLREMR